MKNVTASLFTIVISFILFAFLFTSCEMGEGGKKPSTGSVNELLIVTNEKAQWEGALGDTLREFFARPQTGLPQPEPIFDIINVGSKDFKDIFQKFHNIFIVDINPNTPETTSETNLDIWSQPQRVIKVTAKDLDSFYQEFRRNEQSFMKLFVDLERKRTLGINQIDLDYELINTIQAKFGIYMPLPEGFYIAKETPGFVWLRNTIKRTKIDIELGIMIYTADYNDTVYFNPKHIIKYRNLVTLEHIPGPSPLSYMVVAQDNIPPVFDTLTDFPGDYAIETRGLWEVHNDFMGGPFINYTALDKSRNKVVTFDGYVFFPNQDKKSYIRQLEAIFFASKFSK